MEDITKTSSEWYEELGSDYIINDHDGWDRKNYRYSFYEEEITKEEYNRRLMNSTLLHESQFGTWTTQ